MPAWRGGVAALCAAGCAVAVALRSAGGDSIWGYLLVEAAAVAAGWYALIATEGN